MSWLRNHLRHFVLPGIHTLARHGHRGSLTAVDIKPRAKQVRPSTKCKYVEAGLLYSLVSSVLKKGDPTREIALGLCRQIGRAKDAEFVYAIDARGGIKKLGEKYDGVEGSDVLHSMLCNSMRRLKRKMRRKGSLLLPGRDVWCWEVMARKLTVASTFDARVSRSVAWNQKALRTCIDDWQVRDWDDVLFFDTGFAGSIPKAIAKAEGLQQIKMLLLSSTANEHQIFRSHTGSRAKALAFEYLAKYFQSGTAREGLPYQELNALDEFIKASLLTIWLWYHISPTRLPSYRDKKVKGGNIKIANATDLGITVAGTGVLDVSTDTFVPVGGGGGGAGGGLLVTSNDTSITTGSSNTAGIWHVDTTSSATTSSANFSSVSALSTLDQLWGAGTSGQLLLDKSPPPPTMLQQLQQEVDKEVIAEAKKSWTQAVKKQVQAEVGQFGGQTVKYAGKPIDNSNYGTVEIGEHGIVTKSLAEDLGDIGLVKKPIADPALVPLDKIPPDMAFKSPPILKKVKPLVLNPETFTVHDPQTGVNVEVAEDVKAVLKGGQPTEEGFELGQYPGPPIVNEKMLKTLAGMSPDASGVPEVDLSMEMDTHPDVAGGHPVMFKKTTLTKPDGTKKVLKTPITG